MPAVAAAASSRNRNAPRGRSNHNNNDSKVSKGGLLVTRKLPAPQKSKSNLKDKKNNSIRKLPAQERSFRRKITNKMLQKQTSNDEVSVASSRTNRTKSRSKSPIRQQHSCTRSRSPQRSHSSTRRAAHSPPRRGITRHPSNRSLLSESKESFLCLEPRKPPPKRLSFKSSGRDGTTTNKSGLKRFLSRGNSIRTAETVRSLETISDRLNPQGDKPLSACFPPTASSQQFLLRRPSAKGELTTIENQRGVIVGVVEETHYGRWLLKNSDGKVCAMILLHDERYSSKKYSICGTEPVVYKQTMKYDQVGLGYYKWGHVKNAGGFGGTITLKHTKDEIKQTDYTYCTKPFGSVFRIKKTRGHVVVDADKKECSKLIPLANTGRAIRVGPKMDTALFLCYSFIIDEILEHRIK